MWGRETALAAHRNTGERGRGEWGEGERIREGGGGRGRRERWGEREIFSVNKHSTTVYGEKPVLKGLPSASPLKDIIVYTCL